MTQEDFLNYILDLKRANPSMDIHFCMDSENAYEYGWMPHEIMEVEICPWYETPGGRLLIDETDIKLSMEDEVEDWKSKKHGGVMAEVNIRYQAEVKHAICVFTAAI